VRAAGAWTLAAAAAWLAGCGGRAGEAESPEAIVEDARSAVESGEGLAAERIVSVIPSITEMLFAVGAGDRVVGVSDFCDWPPAEVETRARVGSYLTPNLETIASLRPDLVLAGKWENDRASEALRALGIRVQRIPDPTTIEGIAENVRRVGAVAGRREAADAVADALLEEVSFVRRDVARFRRRPRVYVEVHFPACWTVGPRSFLHDLVEIVGGANVFEDLGKPYDQVSEEAVVARNPEVILSLESDLEAFRARPGWEDVDAVRRGWVLRNAKETTIAHSSQRIGEALRALHERMLPILETLDGGSGSGGNPRVPTGGARGGTPPAPARGGR
jgi:iron complex transport system substrate-binding protein